jgi:hypothetical protein
MTDDRSNREGEKVTTLTPEATKAVARRLRMSLDASKDGPMPAKLSVLLGRLEASFPDNDGEEPVSDETHEVSHSGKATI